MKEEPERGALALPVISVIVPVYDTEKYLHRCIDSILAQTFTDFELLLIDDGSKDKSGAICDEYAAKDGRVRVFHKENGGVSSARNMGLDNACGCWVTFCDSDDWVEVTWLDVFVKNCTDCDLVVQGLTFHEGISRVSKGIDYKGNVQNGLALLVKNAIVGYIVVKMFRMDVIRQKDLHFVSEFRFREDEDFCLKYMVAAKTMVCTKHAAYNYDIAPCWMLKYDNVDMFYSSLSMYDSVKSIFDYSIHPVRLKYLTELTNALFHSYKTKKSERKKRVMLYRRIVGGDVFNAPVNMFSKLAIYMVGCPALLSGLMDVKCHMSRK